MKKIILALGFLSSGAALAGTVSSAKIEVVGFNADTANKFYVMTYPTGPSSECGSFSFIYLPSVTTEHGRALLSMALTAQASQDTTSVVYKVTAPQTCEVTQLQVFKRN
ncbi:hypothetical protein [Atopomonas hussainii]|uniref:hypothetical protein n=1 Tax=Atopomonas hussainii TaxID=1429083 RepID=UPI000B225D0A|nr:hypothetical protein [Atopomonas hussainii]